MPTPIFYRPLPESEAQFIAKTFQGLEQVLADELTLLGATDVEVLRRGVRFTGNRALMYRANYCCRTALRILAPIHYGHVPNENAYYDLLRDYHWNQWLDLDTTFAIDVVTQSERLNHSQYLALRAKDAICDFFRDRFDARPSVDTTRPDVRVHIHLDAENNCTVLLDSSGDSLHLRGYRQGQLEAPMSEVLAAGMLALSGWTGQTALYDPMCGSGTILTEGYLIACRIPPQRWRRRFGFHTWPDFDAELWGGILKEANAQECPLTVPLMGSDISYRACTTTKANLEAIGAKGYKLRQSSFETIAPPSVKGHLVTNPPYDERLVLEDVLALYNGIGSRLKHHYMGWQAWIISSHMPALKHIGLRPSRKIPLFNGPLECRFVGIDLYEGSKKQ